MIFCDRVFEKLVTRSHDNDRLKGTSFNGHMLPSDLRTWRTVAELNGSRVVRQQIWT